MIFDGAVRGIFAASAVTACIALAGCNAEQAAFVTNAKANKPIPQKLISEIQAKQMDPQSPILIRLFKQEAELEVWKQDKTGRYALLQTYPICRWSGELGPKLKEGDRQAPEGFYNITPAQMNPESQFYLAFNMGYPNAFDRSLGRTGSQLMVHGDCSSRGCYAMTDEQISDIYALGRESFFGGQRSFQVQAYPFRMTPQNMAKHRNSPHMPFWKMLKQGNDHFEVTQLEPKVDVCEQRYVFNAEKEPNATRPLSFSPAGKCPVYHVADDIAQAVAEKQRKDEFETAELISRGTPSVAARRGIDGGMHPLFAAKTPNGSTGLSESRNFSLAAYATVPAVPPTVNPPASANGAVTPTMATPASTGGDFMSAAPPPARAEPAPKPQAAPAGVRVASASASDSGGFFTSLAKRIGFGGSDSAPTASTRPSAAQQKRAKTRPPVRQAAPRPQAPVRAAESRPVSGPAPRPDPRPASRPAAAIAAPAPPQSLPPPRGTAMAGAQPVVPSNAFESRWSLR